jgi:hypothetical protein
MTNAGNGLVVEDNFCQLDVVQDVGDDTAHTRDRNLIILHAENVAALPKITSTPTHDDEKMRIRHHKKIKLSVQGSAKR